MTTIEIIRFAHAGDLAPFHANIHAMCRIAYERSDAYHYLTTHMTHAMRTAMNEYVRLRAKPMPHKNGNLYNYETWEVAISHALNDRIIMHLPRDFAMNVWQGSMYDVMLATAWIWSTMARTGAAWRRAREGFIEDRLKHALWTIEACDVLEAQKHVDDVFDQMEWIEVSEIDARLDIDAYNTLVNPIRARWDRIRDEINQPDAMKRAFTEVIVDLWLGCEDKNLYLPYEARHPHLTVIL